MILFDFIYSKETFEYSKYYYAYVFSFFSFLRRQGLFFEMSQITNRLYKFRTDVRRRKKTKRILTIKSYHPFQSSHENQTYNIHFLPSLFNYVHSRECHLIVSTNHAVSVWASSLSLSLSVLLIYSSLIRSSVPIFLSLPIRPFDPLFEQS